jgi:ArsR family transcriptional regulator
MDDRIYALHVEVCKAIAHPHRMKVLDLLRKGERCVCELAPELGITESNLSQHLAILRKAGLVDTRREGHAIFYRVRAPRIFTVIDEMRAILADQLAHVRELAAALEA